MLRQLFMMVLLIGMPCRLAATEFDIEAIRFGPNPLLAGRDALIINYTASKPHVSHYYIYSVGGELLNKQSFAKNIPYVTHSGECKFELIDAATMATFKKQLIVVFAIFESENVQIKKKKYVIVK